MTPFHSLSAVDILTRQAVCSLCGPVRIKNTGGRIWICANKDNARRRAKRFKETFCERCGLEPRNLAVLEIHHKDGDRMNDKSSNYQTLCGNCHNLTEDCNRRGVPVPKRGW